MRLIDIEIGEHLGSSSTAKCRLNDPFELHVGGGNLTGSNERVSQASFKHLGFRVCVRDAELAAEVVRLHKTDTPEAVNAYLQQLLLTALMKSPEYIGELAQENFEAGRVAGRREKVKEIRDAMNYD